MEFRRVLFRSPAVTPLLQRLLPGLGAEERLARLHQLPFGGLQRLVRLRQALARRFDLPAQPVDVRLALRKHARPVHARRSEEHTSELQSLMRISYAVFCLKKKTNQPINQSNYILSRITKQYKNTT